MEAVHLPTIPITIPEGLEDVTPTYLETKRRELALYQTWVTEKNFNEIEKASHKLKGSAGGYGFEALGELARDLNLAAKAHDSARIESVLTEIRAHLTRVVLVSERS